MMKYKVHQLQNAMPTDGATLERFLNSLTGEVISVIPNMKKNSFAQIYGWSPRVDSILVIEKIAV